MRVLGLLLPLLAHSRSLPDLLDLTIEQAHAGLRRGDFNSVDLVHAYLARINEVNDQLRAVLEINPLAIELAMAADDELASGKDRGMLHGLPVLLKDNVGTRGPLNTTAGSFCLLGLTPVKDSVVAARLTDSGAIILGKSTMNEFAASRQFLSLVGSDGWSPRGGQSFGAYSIQQSPSGSSSGSAIAASLGLAIATVGTQTTGSIVGPAAINNVVGIKPTNDLVPLDGLVPFSSNWDSVGPIARTVQDAAAMLSAMTGQQFITSASSSLSGVRIGVRRARQSSMTLQFPRQLVTSDTPSYHSEALERAVDVLRSLGATVFDEIRVPDASVLDNTAWNETSGHGLPWALIGPDLAEELSRYLSQFAQASAHDFDSLLDCVLTDTREQADDLPPTVLRYAQSQDRKAGKTSDSYWRLRAESRYYGGPATLTGLMDRYNLSALSPDQGLDTSDARSHAWPYAACDELAQCPNVYGSSPNDQCYYIAGPNFPYSVLFTGRRYSDRQLIEYAHAFEQATQHRLEIKPLIEPRTQLSDVQAPARNPNQLVLGRWD